jgi:hypothetical protein
MQTLNMEAANSFETSVNTYQILPFLDEVIGFCNWTNPSSHTMALGSAQPLTEMSTKNLLGGIGRPAHKTDNLTIICELIV